ncbi:MAG: DUF523 domain-containing protein [Proteobacteria bacterium]|nr:DUF523 domain-containing protein [Pseudomonadota bacterium]
MEENFSLIFAARDWVQIKGCPGRWILKGDRCSLEEIIEQPLFFTTNSPAAPDEILVTPFADRGGLISYRQVDGHLVHTLNNVSGFTRKLAQLKITDVLVTDGQPGAILLVSACLLGEYCRYDGGTRPNNRVIAQVEDWRSKGGRVVPVCPEELGGMSTPRPPAHMCGGDGHAVLDKTATVRREHDNGDVTKQFVDGAHRAVELGSGATRAILKARSPSCGRGETQIDGSTQQGDGVLAALLLRKEIAVWSG